MRVLRPLLQAFGTAGSLVLAVLVPLVLLALFVGGVSYRKDCLTNDGHAASDWSFTIFAPIPYVFRPSQSGCEVHTGTRVALDALGVATFASPTAEHLIDVSAKGDANLVYWGRVRLILRDYFASVDQVTNYADADELLRSTAARLRSLDAPPAFAEAHTALAAALEAARRAGAQAYQATLNGRRSEAASDLQAAETRVRTAVEHLNAVHHELFPS